ncbi:15-hydroxyprostaglandin dehydrogenase [NAD(+)]-like [Takifugu flavidus]|uniref:15-hydroxyprostaglandin dehydrogenase [NAD(+)] n=1 Tax=Takifugu flavidus TaxID=433684 RepID=A0A5C6P6K1_9TELE|nr:15-hydroxyprostaglandin dehydrogenase [NAD(+)]-like [Takifugu flavidus]TWW74518.1 15-hydroxyprostaglandin dehydrogenase [NAD(+)] [Takifugu flavidus]
MALIGKVAVVTGAAMGLGNAMTRILLQNGAKVVLLDVNNTAGENFQEALHKEYGSEKTFFFKCDVESEQQIKAALKKTTEAFGGIDILCNNAGILNEGEWEKTVSINMVALFRVTYLALEYMNKLNGGRGGVIVNTASMAGLIPLLSCPVYTATKHGVVGFTRAMSLASKASGYGIRFNALCPGFVQTDLFINIPKRLGQFSNLADETLKLVDKFKVLTVTQVAESFLELVTDETKDGEALIVLPDGTSYMEFPVLC